METSDERNQEPRPLQEPPENADRNAVVHALRPFGTTIFSEMTALADRCGAVNLSQGFPDFDGPETIRARAAEALLEGPNQYIASAGLPSFRQAVARKMKRFYDLEVDPEGEVTVTSGATEGLCAAFLALLEAGDEVVLLEPTYDAYPPLAALVRARVRRVPLRGAGFDLPVDELTQAFGSATRAIVINSPMNPCCKVFTREELEIIGALCAEHDVIAIGDEVYEHLVYDGRRHVSLLGIPALRDRALVISSTAKTFSLTGWKVGYAVAPPHLTKAVRMSHQFITFCGQRFLQEAMTYAMDLPDSYYRDLLDGYERKRDFLSGSLRDLGFDVYPTQGTYYVLADISPLGFEDDLEFCRMLPVQAGVAAIPCSMFWEGRRSGRSLVRFCFCKRDDTLEEAVARLKTWIRSR
ncbi:MAG: aminotransferase class I/II-fold pyridoxal phosphate-dependent enzyme [Deltaproteobacteria bacterium]|nr:aminotransferase class I/II-fold pyridoxal phosphate-dependent enzyme [Deltaproteobacteria bacterium]